jgi:hypothetical protein
VFARGPVDGGGRNGFNRLISCACNHAISKSENAPGDGSCFAGFFSSFTYV